MKLLGPHALARVGGEHAEVHIGGHLQMVHLPHQGAQLFDGRVLQVGRKTPPPCSCTCCSTELSPRPSPPGTRSRPLGPLPRSSSSCEVPFQWYSRRKSSPVPFPRMKSAPPMGQDPSKCPNLPQLVDERTCVRLGTPTPPGWPIGFIRRPSVKRAAVTTCRRTGGGSPARRRRSCPGSPAAPQKAAQRSAGTP